MDVSFCSGGIYLNHSTEAWNSHHLYVNDLSARKLKMKRALAKAVPDDGFTLVQISTHVGVYVSIVLCI